MVYDFLAVPRNQGQYTIPAIEFIYYDTDANAYKTLTTEPLELTVKKGSGQANNVVDYSQPAVQDIHPIKTDSANSQRLDRLFFNSAAYWTLLLALLLAFAALLVIFRKRALDNANISKKRGKAANRIATKRLKIANRLMENNKNDQFYDEVLRALWGYVGDKLNLPVSQISKENIDGKLAARGIDSETIALFNRALDECEFNRYAPGDKQDTMRQTYHAAMTAIIKIEDMLKSLKKRKGAKATTITIALLTLCLSVNAQNGAQTADSDIKTSAVSATTTSATATNADSSTNDISDAVAAANHSYQQGNYQQAIASYEALLKREQRADLYYNLGNAYYQTDNITRAVINYERAMQLAPGDDDIRHNLQMATSKTIDKMTLRSEMIFVTWYKSLVFLLSIDAWARLALIALAAALLLLLLYLFATREQLRQWGFNSAALLIVVFLLCNLFAWQQKHSLSHCTRAVVITHTATLKTTPTANSEQKAVIHEGSAVDIKDDSMADWKLIELPDGRNGWVPTADLERI